MKEINIWWSSNDEYQELSNLAYRNFKLGGREFLSVEHAYQCWKSGKFDHSLHARYSDLYLHAEGKKLVTRGVKPKTEDDYNIRVMAKCIEESLVQNENIMNILLNTKGFKLTHNQDRGIWKYKFPEILMNIRDKYSN